MKIRVSKLMVMGYLALLFALPRANAECNSDIDSIWQSINKVISVVPYGDYIGLVSDLTNQYACGSPAPVTREMVEEIVNQSLESSFDEALN